MSAIVRMLVCFMSSCAMSTPCMLRLPRLDRDLFPIAPKGRPVKQCEHCRSARKDKSHHAKCNCGNKKHKDLTESVPKSEHVASSGLDQALTDDS